MALPNLSNIQVVGGYRFPSFYGLINPTMTRTSGCLAIATIGGNLTAWSSVEQKLCEAYTSTSMGTGTNINSWPMLTKGTIWSKSDIFEDRSTSFNEFINGAFYDDENDRLWVTLRNKYWTTADPTQWVGVIDYPGKTVNSAVPNFSGVLPMQMYGGGMTLIPSSWATTNTGGRRLGFASGGYKSGQGSSQGPTFAASELTPTDTPTAVEMMRFATNGQITADNAGTKDLVERTFPEYGPSDISWTHLPDGDPLVGYWASSSVRGGGAWITSGSFDALLHMSVQPTGQQYYHLPAGGPQAGQQTECFTYYDEKKNNLYVYDPDDLADAAAGNITPQEMRGEFYRWDATTNGGYPFWGRGIAFDSSTGYLWVLYENAWGTQQAKNPIIVAYEFVSSGGGGGISAAPTNSAAGTVSGSTAIGATLTFSEGTWNDQGDLLATSSYQWTADSVDISGATSITFNTAGRSAGEVIRCRERRTNSFGFDSEEDTVSSNSITLVEATKPTNLTPGSIAGSTLIGSTLTFTPGTWNDQGDGSASSSYQWTADGVDIGSATSLTFDTTGRSNGEVISCRERRTNSAGFDADEDTLSSNSITLVDGSGATIAFLQDTTSSSDLAAYTFSSQSLGAADDNRFIVVTLTARSTSAGRTLSSVTIGGENASIVSQVTGPFSGGGYLSAAIAVAQVPDGTTGDVVATWSGTMLRCGLGMYRTVTIGSVIAYDTDTSTASPGSASVNVPDGGVVVGVSLVGSTAATTWSGLTEDFDTTIESSIRNTGASDAFETAETDYSITATSGAGSASTVVVSWGPPVIEAPTNNSAGSISGSAPIGSLLTFTEGSWDDKGDSTAFSESQWAVEGEEILDATGDQFGTAGFGVGETVTVRERRTNLFGFDSDEDTASSNSVTITAQTGATVDFLQSSTDTADATTYTFGSQSFGHEDEQRYIIVAVAGRGGSDRALSSVTIGGVSAAIVAEETVFETGGYNPVGIAVAAVPFGSSGSVVVTWDGAVSRCGIGVWRAAAISGTTVSDSDSTTGSPASLSVDIPSGGIAVAASCVLGVTTSAWTGLTEDYDEAIESTISQSAAAGAFASAETAYSIGNTTGATGSAHVAVSFSPGIYLQPTNSVAGTVAGSTEVGSTLTFTPGTWNDQGDGSASSTYQWTADGEDISGATSLTFDTTGRSADEVIRCRERRSNLAGYDIAEDTVSSNSITLEVSTPSGPGSLTTRMSRAMARSLTRSITSQR